MPNYSLQINSQFKPFSFERYIQPLQIYGQAYKEQEEALNNLQMQANTVEAMINRARDTKAAERYDKYMEGLNAKADVLSRRGLVPGVRSSVNTLRGNYFNQIVPIQKAYETMVKQIEEQRKEGDNKIFEYNAGDLSIDDFLSNPEKTYRAIDRKNLYIKSAAAFGALQNELSEYSLQKDSKIKDDFQKAFIKKYGRTPEEVSQFMSEVQKALNDEVPMDQIVASNSTMLDIFNNLYNETRVGGWNSREAELAVANTILSGATSAIGKSDINLVTNQEKVLATQYENAKRLVREKANKDAGIPERSWQQRTFATKRDREEGIEDWKRFKHLFSRDKNGNWHIGYISEATKIPIQIYTAEVPIETPLGKFISKYSLDSGNQENLNKIANKYMGLIDDDYDMMGYSEYYRTIDESDYGNLFDYMSRVSTDNKVKTMEYTIDKNGVPQMSEPGTTELDLKGMSKSNISGAREVESSTGNIYYEVDIEDDEGNINHYSVPIPENVAVKARSRIMEVGDLSNMLNNKDLIENMTAEDLYKLQMDAATYGNESFDILSRYLGTSKTKPLEVEQDESDWEAIMGIINAGVAD